MTHVLIQVSKFLGTLLFWMFLKEMIKSQLPDLRITHISMNTMPTMVFQLDCLYPLAPFIGLVRFVEYHYYLFPLFALAITFVSKGLYNTYFHDLSHVPGPFLGGFTDFYKVYIFACRHIPSGTMELHQQFGLLRIILCN